MTKKGLVLASAGIGFSLVVDAAVSYLIVRLTSNEFTDTTMSFLVYFGLLVAGQFFLGLYANLKRGALLFLYKDTAGSQRIAAMLDAERFPRPHLYHSALLYLAGIVDNPNLDPDIRARAAYLKGKLDGYGEGGGFLAGIRMLTTWDDAVKILAAERNIRNTD